MRIEYRKIGQLFYAGLAFTLMSTAIYSLTIFEPEVPTPTLITLTLTLTLTLTVPLPLPLPLPLTPIPTPCPGDERSGRPDHDLHVLAVRRPQAHELRHAVRERHGRDGARRVRVAPG